MASLVENDTTRVEVTTPKPELEEESDLRIFNYESHQVFDFESKINFDEVESKEIPVPSEMEQGVEEMSEETLNIVDCNLLVLYCLTSRVLSPIIFVVLL